MRTTGVQRAGADVLITAPADAHRWTELAVVQEIAQAFLTATHPLELYRLALTRFTPLVGARFSSLYLRDPLDPSLLKLECAHNWPQESARFLGQLRIREDGGPTGVSATRDTVVEVPDVFGQPALRDWWEPARELGFGAVISLPLHTNHQMRATANASRAVPTAGVLTFYFAAAREFSESERRLLCLVADQLSAMVATAELTESLRSANEQLSAANDELKRRLGELDAARRIENEFLANVTHELRTPLTSILGHAYLLGSEQLGPLNGTQLPALRKIETAGKTLLQLVSDVIDLAQLELGQLRGEKRNEEVMMLTRRAVEEAGQPPPSVALTIHTEESGTILRTDGEMVIRILTSFIRNSYKFTAHGSVRITITRRDYERGPYVEWTVQDTGVGISERDAQLIFEDFRQVDGSSTRLYGGAGVGLSLSRRLAELLGGELDLMSTGAQGAAFTLRLPMEASQDGNDL